ncbi:MAG: hypothetical protein M1834_009095 [Cirrosporium novae-zelandiae]|nr:MAG: hypothetical protein M1834_009095 [Cirrosporium novae-zelandiae]
MPQVVCLFLSLATRMRLGENPRFLNRSLTLVLALTNGLRLPHGYTTEIAKSYRYGIFFADVALKSLQYSGVIQCPTLLLLCEVELGKVLDYTSNEARSSPRYTYNEIYGGPID